jgi:hypothetical protein
MVTIKEYLQKPNPTIHIMATTTQSTDSVRWEPVEGFERFEEFNINTCESLYADVLGHNFDSKDLPTINKLLPAEQVIYSERELESYPLIRNALARSNYAVQAAYKYLNTKDSNKGFTQPPLITCGTKELSGGVIPDWIGRQEGFITPCLCGETKLSTVFQMDAIINTPDLDNLHKPFEQCLHYCVINDTRYGFIVTDEELVIFRIREEKLGDGLASQRSRRAVPPVRYSHASSSLPSSMQDLSLYSASQQQQQGTPKWVQYCVIKWSATDGLTVCLALFLLTMMAYAPDILVDITDKYDPLDRWKWDKSEGLYQNNTSGRMRKKLKSGQIESVYWEEAEDSEGRKLFYSYKGTTYIQQVWSPERAQYYYHDYSTDTPSWDKPRGN